LESMPRPPSIHSSRRHRFPPPALPPRVRHRPRRPIMAQPTDATTNSHPVRGGR
jgi:hypothetical protein